MKLPLTIILCLFALHSYAQEDDIYYQPKDTISVNTDSLILHLTGSTEDQLIYLRYSLSRYHRTRHTAYMLAVSSVISSAGSLVMAGENEDLSNALYIVSGGCAIASFITFWSAEKWLKNASIKVTPKGLIIEF